MITPVALLWMTGEDGSGLLGMVIEVVTGWLHAVIGMVWSERGADLWVRVVPVSIGIAVTGPFIAESPAMRRLREVP